MYVRAVPMQPHPGLAQIVEHLPEEESVVGANPLSRSTRRKYHEKEDDS